MTVASKDNPDNSGSSTGQCVSIILEAGVAIIAALAGAQGRPYLYGLAFTFAAYVLYDLARLMRSFRFVFYVMVSTRRM